MVDPSGQREAAPQYTAEVDAFVRALMAAQWAAAEPWFRGLAAAQTPQQQPFVEHATLNAGYDDSAAAVEARRAAAAATAEAQRRFVAANTNDPGNMPNGSDLGAAKGSNGVPVKCIVESTANSASKTVRNVWTIPTGVLNIVTGHVYGGAQKLGGAFLSGPWGAAAGTLGCVLLN
jgi:hypothetical protein